MVAEIRFFRLAPAAVATDFRVVVESSELFCDEALLASPTSAVIAMDLGHVEERLRGVWAPFLHLPKSVVWIELQRENDGRFRYLGHEGRGSKEGLAGISWGKTRLPDHGATLAQRYGFEPGGHVQPVSITVLDYMSQEDAIGWSIGEEVRWVQNTPQRREAVYRVPAPEWIYAGSTTAFMSGEEFAFYNPANGRLKLILEVS